MRKGDAERRGYLCSAGALTGDDGGSRRGDPLQPNSERT
jgi:hypothetical protein